MNWEWPEIDFQDIGSWPPRVKRAAYGLCFAVVLVIGGVTDIYMLQSEMGKAQDEEITLKQSFEKKQEATAHLDQYVEQLQEIRRRFLHLQQELPQRNEVPGLIDDISHQGGAHGLNFQYLRLLPEIILPFYKELPIQISVSGSYHQLASFVSDVSNLPRIVTIYDLELTVGKEDGKALTMELGAKTYYDISDVSTESDALTQKAREDKA